ncbi:MULTISPECIES: hypothetical protein [Pseudomonas]|uniref:hypothetical protein n=1 Tax=Pseudomonas TaxID=286 RepID=UPI001E52B1D7|nr:MULTISPECIES: hypothetical protein [Pseudomonas]MCE1116810.1 hypothetical protein [Pseudomonas sp. NMI795_08]
MNTTSAFKVHPLLRLSTGKPTGIDASKTSITRGNVLVIGWLRVCWLGRHKSFTDHARKQATDPARDDLPFSQPSCGVLSLAVAGKVKITSVI